MFCPKLLGTPALCQAIGELPFAGVCAASSYWELQCAGSCKLLGDLRFAGFCVVSDFCRFQLARYCFAPSYWGIMLKTPLIWRDRFIIFLKHSPFIWRSSFIMHLKHALSCGDSGSSYIFSTLPPMELAVHHNVSSTRSSCGDSGSSYTLNTAPPPP